MIGWSIEVNVLITRNTKKQGARKMQMKLEQTTNQEVNLPK